MLPPTEIRSVLLLLTCVQVPVDYGIGYTLKHMDKFRKKKDRIKCLRLPPKLVQMLNQV